MKKTIFQALVFTLTVLSANAHASLEFLCLRVGDSAPVELTIHSQDQIEYSTDWDVDGIYVKNDESSQGLWMSFQRSDGELPNTFIEIQSKMFKGKSGLMYERVYDHREQDGVRVTAFKCSPGSYPQYN